MIIGVAFIPAAPLLFPDVDVEHLLDDVRDAVVELVRELAPAAGRVIVIGPAPQTQWHVEGGVGSSRGLGGDAEYALGSSSGPLPQSLAIAASVLEEAAWDGEAIALGVSAHSTFAERARLAGEVVAQAVAVPTLLVVVGDGSATRTEKAPGYLQPDAVEFDTMVAAALGAADTATIVGIDQATADRLWCQGLPAWQVAASAVPSAEGVLIMEAAPFGVDYLIAAWRP